MKKENSAAAHFLDGIFAENPALVLMLGLCPALATTSDVKTALAMGIATALVLVLVSVCVSLFRNVIPERFSPVFYLLITAAWASAADFLMAELFPDLSEALGIYIPLIAVSSLILGRAQDCAGKSSFPTALCDAAGMGIGFIGALLLIASVREILGAGTWYGMRVMPEGFQPVAVFSMAPGAFFTVAFLAAAMNRRARRDGDQSGENEKEGRS